ncbi:MAG: hypothetical protein HY275_09715 [Gemmatimonadetes bacterium]|nr:hypothetical protein [Gemmatimonadota bacterium]
MTTRITAEIAERIARAHGCVRCGERNYKRVKVSPANLAASEEFHESWHVMLRCGVCAAESELGLDDEGDVLYAH